PGYTKSVLPRPAETHVVLMVDSQRRRLGAVIYAFLGFGDQAPHLSARKSPAVVQGRLAERLALPHGVAVALVVVGGHARGLKVGLHIAGQLGTLQPPLGQHGDARGPARCKELRHSALRRARHGQIVEGSIHISAQSPVPSYGFSRQKATGCDGDALVADRKRGVRRALL